MTKKEKFVFWSVLRKLFQESIKYPGPYKEDYLLDKDIQDIILSYYDESPNA